MAAERDILSWRPIHPGDPGPEIFQILASLPAERQTEIIAVISEARGKIASITAEAHQKIAGVLRSKGKVG